MRNENFLLFSVLFCLGYSTLGCGLLGNVSVCNSGSNYLDDWISIFALCAVTVSICKTKTILFVFLMAEVLMINWQYVLRYEGVSLLMILFAT